MTIKKTFYDESFRQYYQLNYPNEEVRHAFLTQVSGSFWGENDMAFRPEAKDLRDALREERTDDFIRILQSFFADIPARLHVSKEAYYHSMTYMMLRLVRITALLEKETNKGRIDAVIEFSDKVYIVEFKFAQNKRVKKISTLSRQAMKQIEEMKYFEPYLASGKRIILFGIGFLNKDLSGETKVLP